MLLGHKFKDIIVETGMVSSSYLPRQAMHATSFNLSKTELQWQ